jgi:hypothetical protein
MSSLSLYTIEDALLQLLEAREELRAEIAADPMHPDIDADAHGVRVSAAAAELAEVEKALAEYVTREVRKVDGIHNYLWSAKVAYEAAREESARFAERARRIKDSSDRLKQLCCDVLAAAGKKRLDGTGGRYLLRKGNGGLQPLQVQEDVLPEELVDVTVRLPLNEWRALAARGIGVDRGKIVAREPANDRIRAALQEPCKRCGGIGERPEVGPDPCIDCNGTGKATVPGARLLERGEHLECK